MNLIRISHYIDSTKVLGPFQRSALWVNGCCFSCDGCLAGEMNSKEPLVMPVDQLASVFLSYKETEGITISGGEPFLQAEALTGLIDLIRNQRDYGVIIYSGFTYEELKEKGADRKAVQDLLEKTDILIDGRYKKELDDGRPFRGSANQRILLLSDRYQSVWEDYYLSADKRNIEIKVTSKNIYLVGVPSEYGLATWKKLRDKAELK